MEWKKFQQQQIYFKQFMLDGDIYTEHLAVLFSEKPRIYDYGTNQLRCWNIRIQYFPSYFSWL